MGTWIAGQALAIQLGGRCTPLLKPLDSLLSIGSHSIQINHLSIASSQVELVEAKTIDVSIQNVSVVFRGTLNYGYTGAWG